MQRSRYAVARLYSRKETGGSVVGAEVGFFAVAALVDILVVTFFFSFLCVCGGVVLHRFFFLGFFLLFIIFFFSLSKIHSWPV
jgi:hypothetical protein